MQQMQFHNNYKVSNSILIILTISTVLSKQLVTYAAVAEGGSADGVDGGGGGGGVGSRVDLTNAKNVSSSVLAQVTTINNADNSNSTTTTKPVPARLPPPPQVKLNKCCRIGEYLNSEHACVAGTSERWVPLIYMLARKAPYKPLGAYPKFFSFEENVRPLIPHKMGGKPNEVAAQQCAPEDLQLFTGSGSNIVIFSNGSLWIHERYINIEPSSYCVDRDAALVCFPKQSEQTAESTLLKLKKCCGKYGSYDVESKSCFFEAEHDGRLRLPLNESYETHFGFPKCDDAKASYAIIGDWHKRHIDNETGQFLLPHVNLTHMQYCVEHLRDEIASNASDAPTIKVIVCTQHLGPAIHPDNIVTHFNTNTGTDKLEIAVLNVGIVVSIIFLAATLIAGYMMPSVHHVLHWRCQIYYVFCLFIGDTLLAYSQLSTTLDLDSVQCFVVASAMHFFFLSAFFWLNTMCFNIWWTFRDFRPSSLERNQELLRLRLYSAYAWGIPFVITTIAAIVDRLPETQLLRPGFGERGCWFSGDNLAIFAYFFGPVGILLVVNIILFISTTHQLTCGLWKRDDVKSTTEKTALGKVCLKLVVVMGVTWIADVISSLVGGPHSPWFFTDLINALQGVFIFIVVGCQPQVWAACKRFCCPRSRQEITNTTNGVQHSSSSHGLPSLAVGESTQNTSVVNTTIGGNNGTLNTTITKIPMETVC